jgi:hypothetical protein
MPRENAVVLRSSPAPCDDVRMRSPSSPARLAACWAFACVLIAGCAFGSTPSKAPASRPPATQVYSVWEFDTIAALDQMLDIKGCEGWGLAEAFPRGEKMVAIFVANGAAPASNPACRPST